jgi:predicted Ser/Thr protein kinase
MIGLTAATLLGILFAFPDGRFVLRGTMWQGPIWWLGFQLSTLFPGSVLDFFSWPSSIFLAAALASFGYGVYVQIYRYRRISSAVQRQQTKWAVMAFAALIAFSVVFPAIVTTFFPVVERPGLPHILYNVLQQTLFVAAAAIWGISIAFSVLRYRLWDVDLVINRSLIYGALTALLGIVFSVTLLAVQQVMQALTGGMQSPIALAITALVIGALFQPTQKRLHRLINRRLYHVAVDFDKVEAKHPITNPGALSGTNLGQYKVLEPIGRGGMGEVYRGYHPGLDRTVAIKVLPQFFASEQEFAKRFEREAKSVASLNHPNIVQVYDFGYQDGVSYMVMEYINGLELSMMLKQAGKLPIDMVVAIVSKIASALDYAHEQGLVHRDIKPSNIMLEQNGKKYPCAVLMDFGIARLVNSGTRMTGTGMLGTLDYVAPEQIMAAREVDHRADIYSLGVTTYQMLTGTVPFKGGDVANVIFGHLYKPAPNPCGACPNVPPHVAEAVMKAMAKSPIDRFQTAGEFARVILTVTHTSG